MDSARAMLKSQSPLELTAASVSRAAGTAPPSFYVYFTSTRDLMLALAEESVGVLQPLAPHLAIAWPPSDPGAWAGAFIADFITLWSDQAAVISYRNLEADRGDTLFEDVRTRAMMDLTNRLATRIAQTGRVAPIEAFADSGILLAAIERVAMAGPTIPPGRPGMPYYVASLRRMLAAAIAP